MSQQTSLLKFAGPRYWPVWLGLGLARLGSMLPYRLQLAIGTGLGRLMYPLAGKRARIAKRNIELCFPDMPPDEVAALARDHFKSLGIAILETAMCWYAPDDRLRNFMEVEGAEHLEAALANGKGAIMLAAHFTTLEMGARMLSMCTSLQVMYRRHRNPLFEEIMRRGREQRAEKAIPRKDVRAMVRSLKNNQPVWYAPDQSLGTRFTAIVPFFSEPCVTNTATSRIAKMSGAPVLPFFQERLPDGRGYRIIIGEALENFPSGDDAADAVRFNQLIEANVRRVPAQYLWVHRRFKGRGEDYPDPYAA
ncbi:MAG: LpxL/LpxP family Kdo(2)-lipid IV(A) lauroyl/palmitoleoyl acyltransferase [Pseudomonadota bacterium]